MNFYTTDLPGILKLEPRVHKDNRGYLFESYSKKEIDKFINDLQLNFGYQLKLNANQYMDLDLNSSTSLIRCIIGKVELNIISINKKILLTDIISDKEYFQYLIPKGYKVSLKSLSEETVLEIQSDKELSWP